MIISVVKRSFGALVLTSSLVACGAAAKGSAHPVNVAAVRQEIKDVMPGGRTITSMGHVTDDRAVVYTKSDSGIDAEEVWVKSGGAWRLDSPTAAR